MFSEFSLLFLDRIFAGVLFLSAVLLFPCFPDTPDSGAWVIAAERFDTENVPDVYRNFSEALPRLLLSRVSAGSSRTVLQDEQTARKLKAVSADFIRLVQERSDLLLARDKIFLTTDSFLVKMQKKNDLSVSISGKEQQIRDLSARKRLILREAGHDEQQADSPVAVWKDGITLYTRPADVPLFSALSKDKISALLSGSIKDIGGYMYVTVSLITGLDDVPVATVSDAAPYDEVDMLVSTLSARLLPDITNRKTVRLQFTVTPATARVFIDDHPVSNIAAPLTVFSGKHTVTVSGAGYVTATKVTEFDSASLYDIRITLAKEETVTVQFDTPKIPGDLFINTKYFGETPQTITIPALPSIGEVVTGTVPTYFVFDPGMLNPAGENRVMIKNHITATNVRIEKQRSLLYWSLGALYISLPFSMISYGIALDTYQAYLDGKLPNTNSVIAGVNNWNRVSQVTSAISIGLGINVAFQLVRYFLAAEQSTPQFAENAKTR
jgi:hypothetical protein